MITFEWASFNLMERNFLPLADYAQRWDQFTTQIRGFIRSTS